MILLFNDRLDAICNLPLHVTFVLLIVSCLHRFVLSVLDLFPVPKLVDQAVVVHFLSYHLFLMLGRTLGKVTVFDGTLCLKSKIMSEVSVEELLMTR